MGVGIGGGVVVESGAVHGVVVLEAAAAAGTGGGVVLPVVVEGRVVVHVVVVVVVEGRVAVVVGHSHCEEGLVDCGVALQRKLQDGSTTSHSTATPSGSPERDPSSRTQSRGRLSRHSPSHWDCTNRQSTDEPTRRPH